MDVWKRRRVAKAQFLTDVRGRLTGEVGLCVDVLRKARTGFWAMARMVFPVVEAVATVIYRTNNAPKPPILLGKLGFEHPNLIWQMYRHTLMHNDEMAPAVHRRHVVSWEMNMGGGHKAADGVLGIDVLKLYEDLFSFLEQEIVRA
jgi:hypothetical protein